MSNIIKKDELNSLFSEDKIKLLKDTVCKGATDNELQLFLHVCEKVKLDPFMKQIYSIPRKQKNRDGTYVTVRTIQMAIDGYRVIAERTGNYAPGKEPSYVYDKDGRVFSATAYIKKRTSDGVWHEVSATAFMSEYYVPGGFFDKMPHGQLAKCAETLALRKAFPAELGAIRTDEEMDQADRDLEIAEAEVIKAEIEKLDPEKCEKEIEVFFKLFEPEKPLDLSSYLNKYAEHYKKTRWDAYQDYRPNPEKFLTDFSKWIKKQVK